jgi:hypothetical protein
MVARRSCPVDEQIFIRIIHLRQGYSSWLYLDGSRLAANRLCLNISRLKRLAGIERIRAARTKHGRYTAEMIELRRRCAEARRAVRALVQAVE